MTQPTELFLANGRPAGVWYCGQCRRVKRRKKDAVECCLCSICGKVIDDKKKEYTGYHRDCWYTRQAEREAELLEAAELVDDYDGWVFTDRRRGNDGYFKSPQDAIESLEGELDPEDMPEFMFCCNVVPCPKVRVDWITEQCAEDYMVGIGELAKAIDAFKAANTGLLSYTPDRTRKVRLRPTKDPS